MPLRQLCRCEGAGLTPAAASSANDATGAAAVCSHAMAEVTGRLTAACGRLPEAWRALAAECGRAVVGDAVLTHPPESADVIHTRMVELAIDGVTPAAAIVVLSNAHVYQGPSTTAESRQQQARQISSKRHTCTCRAGLAMHFHGRHVWLLCAVAEGCHACLKPTLGSDAVGTGRAQRAEQSGMFQHLLVAANCVDAGAAFTLALLLGEGDAGHQALVDLGAGVHAGALVDNLHEALTTLAGVASEGVDALGAAQGAVETAASSNKTAPVCSVTWSGLQRPLAGGTDMKPKTNTHTHRLLQKETPS